MDIARWKGKLDDIYQKVDHASLGGLSILQHALDRFSHVRGAEAAASMAYYTIFSIFPLMLVLAAILKYLLVSSQIAGKLLDFISQAMPLARQLIAENFTEILQQHSAVGWLGLVGLTWSASGAFLTLARNVNRAWPMAPNRNFWQGRLIALSMVGILVVLLVLWLLTSTLFSLLPHLGLGFPDYNQLGAGYLAPLISGVLSWAIAYLFFFSIYRWLPNIRVHWIEAFWGALASTLGWELITFLFSLYLNSRFYSFPIIYGSPGALLALLLWIYLSALITLFGAHLSAAVASAYRLNEARHPPAKV